MLSKKLGFLVVRIIPYNQAMGQRTLLGALKLTC
jgi:hypothetical protein